MTDTTSMSPGDRYGFLEGQLDAVMSPSMATGFLAGAMAALEVAGVGRGRKRVLLQRSVQHARKNAPVVARRMRVMDEAEFRRREILEGGR